MINISVILVSGGFSGSSVGRSVELLHTNGSRICSLPDLPYSRRYHSQTGVTACGGVNDASWSTCHTISSNGSWEVSHNLAQARGGHSAWASPLGTILIGAQQHSSGRTTTEILMENGDTVPGFNLDYDTE